MLPLLLFSSLSLSLSLLQLGEFFLLPFFCLNLAFGRRRWQYWLGKWCYSFLSEDFSFHKCTLFETFVDNFAELVDLIQGLLVLLLELSNDFERSMLLAENPWDPLSIDSLDFHVVVRSPSTLYMKRYVALFVFSAVLTRDASPCLFLATNDTLQVEPPRVQLRHPHRRLWGHARPWHPDGTAQVDPLVQGLGWDGVWTLQPLLVPLDEERIVARQLSISL